MPRTIGRLVSSHTRYRNMIRRAPATSRPSINAGTHGGLSFCDFEIGAV